MIGRAIPSPETADFGFGDVLRLVVRLAPASSQHDVPVRIPHGFDDRGLPIGIDADEMMGGSGGCHGVHGHMQTAFRAVLEADRHRHTACHLPVGLTFRGSGSNSGPADEIGNVLRADRIQQLGGAGHAELIDL